MQEKRKKIGGFGKIEEINTSKYAKKYNRGNIVIGSCVLCMVEKAEDKIILLAPVLKRNKETLHRIINESVEVGTIIITDKCKGYYGLSDYSYIQKKINHSVEYSKRENGLIIHTNTIEGNWRWVKELCPTSCITF